MESERLVLTILTGPMSLKQRSKKSRMDNARLRFPNSSVSRFAPQRIMLGRNVSVGHRKPKAVVVVSLRSGDLPSISPWSIPRD